MTVADQQHTPAEEPRIHSQQLGGHWVAWVGEPDGRTARGWTVVGETREQAEARARARLDRPAPVGDRQP